MGINNPYPENQTIQKNPKKQIPNDSRCKRTTSISKNVEFTHFTHGHKIIPSLVACLEANVTNS